MPPSREMREKLTDRLAAVSMPAIHIMGPDMRCATVEDAERLSDRLKSWLDIFIELEASSTLEDDRVALPKSFEAIPERYADLETAIFATRTAGVPWEETRNLIAARNISGSGTIDPRL